jgi:uncharacterized protein HemX
VQQNDTLFTSSIADAKDWLKKNFAENQQTEQFIVELDKLSGVQLKSQYPDISNSLKLLKNISKFRVETDKALEPETKPVEPPAAPANPESSGVTQP